MCILDAHFCGGSTCGGCHSVCKDDHILTYKFSTVFRCVCVCVLTSIFSLKLLTSVWLRLIRTFRCERVERGLKTFAMFQEGCLASIFSLKLLTSVWLRLIRTFRCERGRAGIKNIRNVSGRLFGDEATSRRYTHTNARTHGLKPSCSCNQSVLFLISGPVLVYACIFLLEFFY